MFDCCSWTAPNINGLHTAFPLIIFFKRTHNLKDFDYAYICIYTFGKLVWKKKYNAAAADALKALEQNVYTESECTLSGSMVYTYTKL